MKTPPRQSVLAILHPLFKWLLLAFACGCVNTGGYLACHRFVSHVTGFATLLGLNLGRRKWLEAVAVMTVPLYFIAGSMFTAWIVERRIQRGTNPHYALPLSVAGALLVLAAIGGSAGSFHAFGGEAELGSDYVLIVTLCLSCGIQNAAVTVGTGTILRSSHLTGTTTDLGTGLVRLLCMPTGSVERHLEYRFNCMRAATIAFFVAGAIAGAYIFPRWEYAGFWAPALIVFGVAAGLARKKI